MISLPDQQAVAHLDPVREMKATLVSQPNPFLEIALGSQTLVKSQSVWPRTAAGRRGGHHDLQRNDAAGRTGREEYRADQSAQERILGRARRTDGFKPLVSEVDKDAALMRFVDVSDVQLHSATEFKPAPGAHVYVDAFGKPLDLRSLGIGAALAGHRV